MAANNNPTEVFAGLVECRFGFDPMRDIQVLCPMNRGGLGARSLTFGTTFGIGDKVDDLF